MGRTLPLRTRPVAWQRLVRLHSARYALSAFSGAATQRLPLKSSRRQLSEPFGTSSQTVQVKKTVLFCYHPNARHSGIVLPQCYSDHVQSPQPRVLTGCHPPRIPSKTGANSVPERRYPVRVAKWMAVHRHIRSGFLRTRAMTFARCRLVSTSRNPASSVATTEHGALDVAACRPGNRKRRRDCPNPSIPGALSP